MFPDAVFAKLHEKAHFFMRQKLRAEGQIFRAASSFSALSAALLF